jgi:hypothetical protein
VREVRGAPPIRGGTQGAPAAPHRDTLSASFAGGSMSGAVGPIRGKRAQLLPPGERTSGRAGHSRQRVTKSIAAAAVAAAVRSFETLEMWGRRRDKRDWDTPAEEGQGGRRSWHRVVEHAPWCVRTRIGRIASFVWTPEGVRAGLRRGARVATRISRFASDRTYLVGR